MERGRGKEMKKKGEREGWRKGGREGGRGRKKHNVLLQCATL